LLFLGQLQHLSVFLVARDILDIREDFVLKRHRREDRLFLANGEKAGEGLLQRRRLGLH